MQRLPIEEQEKTKAISQTGSHPNWLKEIDYEEVLKLKSAYSRDLYLEEGAKLLSSDDYNSFSEQQRVLFPYACYCTLRDRNGNATSEIGTGLTLNEQQLREWLKQMAVPKETNYWYLHNICCTAVLSSESLHQFGITLKGISPSGSIVQHRRWTSPHLFNMDTQSGASS